MRGPTVGEPSVGDRCGPADDPDRYHLISLKSRGGEGHLWKGSIAVDGVDLPVAVKIVDERHIPEIDIWRERWQRQAELLRSLEHPSLVKVREVFEGPAPHRAGAADPSTRMLYLVMNWAEGATLTEWVERNPDRDVLDSVRIIAKVAGAVEYLHQGAVTGHPVLHRDIKPSNVIVDGANVRLVDFGFVRIDSQEPMTLAGTPSYMAPEVVSSGRFTEASDRYSLGALAYYAITGDQPRPGDYAGMRAHLLGVPGVEGRDDFARYALAMMNPSPDGRPTSAVEWAQYLAATAVSDASMTQFRARPDGPATATDAAAPTGGSSRSLPTANRPKRRRTGLLVGLAIVVVLAVAAGAFVALSGGGGDSTITATAPDDPGDGGSGSDSSASSVPTMPDVVGSDVAEARSLLAKAKIKNVILQKEESGAAEGTVLSQTPTSGQKATGQVTLVVATPPVLMPNVVGMTLSDATTLLEGRGATITVNTVLDENKTDGAVTAQNPASGSPFSRTVTLDVARRPNSTYLESLTPVEGSVSGTGLQNVSGQAYLHSVWLENTTVTYKTVTVSYDLQRKYRKFLATLGLGDSSNSGLSVRAEVYLDGRLISSQDIKLGMAVALDLDVTDGLRLKFVSTTLSGDQGRAFVTWGDARILGTPQVGAPVTATTTTTPR